MNIQNNTSLQWNQNSTTTSSTENGEAFHTMLSNVLEQSAMTSSSGIIEDKNLLLGKSTDADYLAMESTLSALLLNFNAREKLEQLDQEESEQELFELLLEAVDSATNQELLSEETKDHLKELQETTI